MLDACWSEMEIGSKEWSNVIIDGATSFDIDLDHNHIRQFTDHAKELVRWTKKINITSITDPRDVAIKHFLDSLSAARLIPPGASLLDIGSGGGFPGIPLKVLIPSLSAILIDASRKKVSFLKHIIRTLKLNHIDALHIRAEGLAADPNYRNRFDVIIGRALSSLESFVRLALPLLSKQGVIIALKGHLYKDELDDLRSGILEKKDYAVPDDRNLTMSREIYDLPFLNSKRSIITVRKIQVSGEINTVSQIKKL